MTPSIADQLSGTLGARHRCLNALVNDAHQRGTPLPTPSIDSSDQASVDRLFAIDLASKQHNLEYILLTLKDDDMLYVSRALKSLWLLEPKYSHVINPKSLEQDLFPQMRLQALNKMKHWIQLHLRDAKRCEEFYQFYKDTDFDTAAKFLWHCSNEFILREITSILGKITPRHLKVLSEKVPQVTKIYYDSLRENQDLLKYYLQNDTTFFANVKYVLKSDPDVFFYVLEHFFNIGKFRSFNSAATKYILKNHKNRFMEKQELYTAKFLNMDALAKCLNSQEAKELVVKLAKAEYLADWFSYKTVEPLIKRLGQEERKPFKKFIFVDKAFGTMEKEWPYAIPSLPELKVPQTGLFEDIPIERGFYPDHDVCRQYCSATGMDFRCQLKKRKCCKWAPVKTVLDELFDKYRFSNYKETLVELRKKLKAESSAQNRQYMLLVLVSKTGGRTEDLISLLELMTQYKNEPVQIRAAIVRSLVKRAFVWRLPPEHWAKLVQWGHGLGLDGSPPEAACREGLHAVVIRDMLAGATTSELVLKTFLDDFSDLTDYSFTTEERRCIRARLPALILAAAQSDPDKAMARLHILLDTLAAYRIRFDNFPGTIETITEAAQRDLEATKSLLTRVYAAGVARKRLIKENFQIIQTDASYVNALRHDISILENMTKFEELIGKKENKIEEFEVINKNNLKLEKFARKLALYFTEKNGLAERYRAVLEQRATATSDIKLARLLALLAGTRFPPLLKVFDAANRKTPQRQLAAALRANAHVVRPAFDLESFGWRTAGAKAVGNYVVTCRQTDVERHLQEALSWRCTLRLALILAKRTGKEQEAYEVFASKRPGAALMCALRYFRREGDDSDMRIWDIVKTHTPNLHKDQLRRIAGMSNRVTPLKVCSHHSKYLAEFWVLVYKACKVNLPDMQSSILSQIPKVLPEIDQQFVFEEIDVFLKTYLKDCSSLVKIFKLDYDKMNCFSLYIGILARFLMLSTSEEMLEDRLQKVGIPFFKCFERMWKQASEKNEITTMKRILDSFLLHFRYNQVYFDVKYVSCLPVFEKLTQWMHGFLPIEKWFGKYVTVHLSMVYFKTVRLCLKQKPELFADEAQKLKEGPNMLGTIFGKFITSEVEELVKKYFPSVTELYKAEVVDYFRKYYGRRFDDKSVQNFLVAVVYGLLQKESVASCVLAKDIVSEFNYILGKDNVKNILKRYKEIGVEELCFAIDDVDDDDDNMRLQ